MISNILAQFNTHLKQLHNPFIHEMNVVVLNALILYTKGIKEHVCQIYEFHLWAIDELDNCEK